MAEHSSTSAEARPVLARLYGIRLLYQPRARSRLAVTAAALALAAFAWVSVAQVVSLDGVNLHYDFPQFYAAASVLSHAGDPYAEFLAACPAYHWCLGGYIYPPLLAELLRPLAALPFTTALRAWLVVGQACLWLSAWLLYRALRGHVPTAALALLLVATVAFRPLQYTLYFAQVGLLLALLLAAATASFMRTESATGAGAALGFAAVLRVSPVLVIPALARRPRALLVAGATAAGTLAVLSLLTPHTLEYFTAVLPRIGASTGIVDNQAPQGLLLRAAALWGLPSPPGPLAGVVVAVLVLGPTAWLALRGDGDIAWRGALIGAFIAAMPLVSSLTWEHHLVTELVAFAALLPGLSRVGRGWARWLVLAAYPLLWLDRHYTDWLVGALGLSHPAGWQVAPFLLVTGVNLAGMTCLWVGSLLLLRRLAVAVRAA